MTAHRHRQSGAALLLAMVILTLVATLAAGMVWQQSRAVTLEAGERASNQAGWILEGALDWARLLLREDARSGKPTALTEPWATPLAEARLSSFLAADRDNNNAADTTIEAFLSGGILDAQARYNLRNLVDGEGKVADVELRGFEKLCAAVGVPDDVAGRIASGLRAAWFGDDTAPDSVPLPPSRPAQLVWLGIDAAVVERLDPYVTLLPVRTAINVNTAPREVLLAAVDGLDSGSAERLVQARQREAFRGLEDIQKLLPEAAKADSNRIGWKSAYFIVYGRLRLDERIVEERTLVERRGADRGLDVVPLLRERTALMAQRQ